MDTILITGGTGGLGATVTLALLDHGYRCLVPYSNIASAQKLRETVAQPRQDRIILFEADLLREEGMQAVDKRAEQYGNLYGLVHLLGGVRSFHPVSRTATEDWDFLMNVNLRSFFLAARLAMMHFERTLRGRIVSIGAMASVKPSAGQSAYGVAKAGVAALTKILADEGRAMNVTANCIAPGIIRTAANLSWASEEETTGWVTPDEIAAMIVYLLGDAAAGVNGSVLHMFGGMNV